MALPGGRSAGSRRPAITTSSCCSVRDPIAERRPMMVNAEMPSPLASGQRGLPRNWGRVDVPCRLPEVGGELITAVTQQGYELCGPKR
jgi:hypothetical protein